MRAKGVTVKQVAEKAGVSVMTVSLALRGDDSASRMTPDTRQRVLDAARELGYTPNARARALRLGRTNVIGLYMGHGVVDVRIPYFTEIVGGIQEGCELVRKDLLLHGTFHQAHVDEVFAELLDGRIDGLIVSLPSDSPLARKLARSNLPAIAVADAIPDIPSVTVDDADGSRQIVEHLHGRGHRSVVYGSCPDPRIRSAQRREAAFARYASEFGLQVQFRSLVTDSQPGQLALDTIGSGATALVCWHDTPAYYYFGSCGQLGIRVPEDLAIVGFDDATPASRQESPTLTTVHAPWAEVARRAVLLLDQQMKGEPVPPETVLPVRLAAGKTT